MTIPAFAQHVLYPQSPFLPSVTIGSATEISNTVNQEGLHPATAIAHEIRYLGNLNSLEILEEAEWISEKFHVQDENVRDYIYGFMFPPSLLIALDMIQEYSHAETMNYLFNESLGNFEEMAAYTADQMKRAGRLVRWEDPNPMTTGKAIFDYCSVEVFTLSSWYNIGVEASRHLFESFAQMFDIVYIDTEQS